jgi:[ribosomal protein S5]-alanine N-acetyltransferase
VQIDVRRLSDVSFADLAHLLNDADVRRHLPLAIAPFDEETCACFVAEKQRMWDEHGFGPWAFFVDGRFAGWGGLQPDGDDADLGFVLHRAFWGIAPRLARDVLRRAFTEMGRPSVIALLPPSRTRVAALARLGFVREGAVVLSGQPFQRFRLEAHVWQARHRSVEGAPRLRERPGDHDGRREG